MPPAPPPRHHHSFFDIVAEIVEFAVGAFVMVLGQGYLVPLLVEDCGALVGGALGWGVTGAASDAARQGVAMATGEQSKFSWEELGQSAELSAITGGLKEELEVNVFPHAPNTTLGGDTPIPRSVFSSYGMTLLENETIAVAKNLVLMATGQEKRFAWKDLINTAGQSILNVTVDNALGVTNNEPNLLAALLNTELGAVISSAVYKNTIDPWQAAGEAFGMYGGQTLIASQRVYVHKKDLAQQKKRDQEEFKKEIASSMETAFNEALQEMDMDPTFLAGKYFTGTVSNNKKPSVGFWGQPLDGIKHRPSKSDQDRKKQHNDVIDQASQQAHQHHDTDLSYAQYVQQNSVEGMWQQRMSQTPSKMKQSALSTTLDVLENALLGLVPGGSKNAVEDITGALTVSQALDIATDTIPRVPIVKGGYELLTGNNPITGESVSTPWALIEMGSGLLPVVGPALKTVGFFATVGKVAEKGLVEGKRTETLYHTVTSSASGQGILNRINPERFNPKSRFGEAFYLSEIPDTTLAELAHYNAVGKYTLRFSFNKDMARILDFTNPTIAKSWGYSGGNPRSLTRDIGLQAQEAGFNVIRYSSERGVGANLAVFNDFERLLEPQMIIPSPEFDVTLMRSLYVSLGVK